MEKILKNPIYYGYFKWNGKLSKGNHRPLISKELFNQVQTQLQRFDKPKKGKLCFAFRGLLTCGYCGCQMTAQGQGGKYVYYNCTGAKGKCGQKYIREEHVAQKLGEAIKDITLDETLVDWIKESLKSSHSDENEFH
jgi:site-specific DNA recombinase